jgi:hypothetical protein
VEEVTQPVTAANRAEVNETRSARLYAAPMLSDIVNQGASGDGDCGAPDEPSTCGGGVGFAA